MMKEYDMNQNQLEQTQPNQSVVYPNKSDNPIPASPVHPFAAMTIILLDNLWGVGEGASALSLVGVVAIPLLMVLTGVSGFFSTLLIQRFLARDGWGSAFAKAFFLAVVAGVPFQVMGTAAGATFLGWAGISGLSGMLTAGRR